ncbi:MAG TPA: hypothetical protein VMJ49_10380 [Gaiellaceae bacterium]|nr:hypothetical protein [Gaiellaceae bacterium]
MAAVEPEEPAKVIMELLHGFGVILMSIDAHVASIHEYLGGEDEEEEDDS